MGTEYNYEIRRSLAVAKDVREAIEITVLNYFCDQLGWSEALCHEQVLDEESRRIPKGVLDEMERLGWKYQGKKVIEIGTGQGGMMLELLERGADSYGVEPGPEFAALARMRLKEAGHDASRIHQEPGEALPFPSNSFGYAVSLQVLEHVADPAPVLREIFRVLAPGGQCHLRCDNYLSFTEPHYRIRWLPLLPKTLGSLYLKILGRDPVFLRKYIYYTTYPQIWKISSRVGFINLTYRHFWEKFQHPSDIRTLSLRTSAYLLRALPPHVSKLLVDGYAHSKNFWRPGVTVTLQKPFSQ